MTDSSGSDRMSRTADLFFMVSTFLISIPTGIKFFNWLATMYGGRISFASPMLFCIGFLSMFLIGGLTGIMLAAAPFDFQLQDTYFLVGHFHFVLIGGTVFAALAGVHYWYPKVTGRPLNELKQVAESTLTAIMGRMSAYTGKEVTWDFLVNKSQENLMPEKLSFEMSLSTPPVAVPTA